MTKPISARRRTALLAIALSGAAPGAFAQATPAGAPAAAAAASAAAPARAPAAAGAGATSAGPVDPAERGAELRRKGNRAWREGRYADALVDYEEAARLSPEPKNFYNLASAYEKVGRYADALAALSRFKSGASREELDDAPGLEARVNSLRKRVAVLKVHVNVPGARVLVRDAIVGTQPADRPLEVSLNEGRAPVEILHEGYQPYRKEHTLQGGSSLELDVQLNRQAPPVTVVEKTKTIYVTSSPAWSQWWFWAGASVLAVGGAATIYALSTEKDPSKSTFGPDQVPTSWRSRLSGLSLRF
ncbi:MAG TPA: PEGA domain-containing protein [Polyangiaceae bacterium]|nr:PEGA domain-containing protein [Polyangiaceae bacterium]